MPVITVCWTAEPRMATAPRSWKALMMPSTVPKSPTNGALLPSVPRKERKRSYRGRSAAIVAAITSSTIAGPCGSTASPCWTMRASSACCPSTSCRSPSSSPRERRWAISSACCSRRARKNTVRSRMTASEAMESATRSHSTHSAEERVILRSLLVSQPTSARASARTVRVMGMALVIPRPDDVRRARLGIAVGCLEGPFGKELVLQSDGVRVLVLRGVGPHLARIPQVDVVGEVLARLERRALDQVPIVAPLDREHVETDLVAHGVLQLGGGERSEGRDCLRRADLRATAAALEVRPPRREQGPDLRLGERRLAGRNQLDLPGLPLHVHGHFHSGLDVVVDGREVEDRLG